MGAGHDNKVGTWPTAGVTALVMALAMAGGVPWAGAQAATAGVGAPVVGRPVVVRPAPRPAPRPVVRPAQAPRAPTVVTPRPKLPPPKPVAPADPTPIIQPAPFRTNTPTTGGQPGMGAPLGVLPGGLATPLVGPAPAPNTCWFYTTPAKTVGYWSKCP